MTLPIPPRPTDAELAILRALWEHGPCTVRRVQEALARDRATGYTTALKMLQVITEKGLVERDESQRSHVYRARRSEEQTQKQLAGDLIRRAFGGSARALVMRALEARPASADQQAEIRRLLDWLEQEQKPVNEQAQGGDS